MLTPKDKARTGEPLDREYIGTVEDHSDPLGLGRLRIRIPEIYGDIPKDHLPWANPSASFGGGKGFGMFMIPTPGSKVRVRLFRGHPWTPEWIGTHWFQNEPPKESQISPPHNYLIKTPKGHLIDLHDDKPYVRIRDSKGNFIILNTEKSDLEIKVGNDSHQETDRDYDETVGRSKHTRTKAYMDEKIGSHRRTFAKASISFDALTQVHIRAGGSVFIEGGATVNILSDGGPVNIESATIINLLAGIAINLDAPVVNINSGAALPATPANPKHPD